MNQRKNRVKLRTHLQMDDNKSNTFQNLWCIANVVLREFMAFACLYKKKEDWKLVEHSTLAVRPKQKQENKYNIDKEITKHINSNV
jgi:hypothetical protein